ncbi:MAG: hypothetical protein JSR80_08520 [Verrucomicrobia bacterium]|nr:hypothetical protein [Verrucomicrobiota bacterium]
MLLKVNDLSNKTSFSYNALSSVQVSKILPPIIVLGSQKDKEIFINAVSSQFEIEKEKFIAEFKAEDREKILRSGHIFCCGVEGVADYLEKLKGDGKSLVEGQEIFDNVSVYQVINN